MDAEGTRKEKGCAAERELPPSRDQSVLAVIGGEGSNLLEFALTAAGLMGFPDGDSVNMFSGSIWVQVKDKVT